MGVALKLFEQLTDAANDEARFRLIAEAIGQLEDALPRPGEIASPHHVRESELRLQREIEVVRKEIEVVRGENKDMELRLQKEIKQVELQVQEVRVEVKATEASLRTAIHRQTLWVVGAVGAVVGFIRLLEWLLP
jgi:hypothetical protein